MKHQISDGVLTVVIDPGIYSLDVINKCFYWYGDKYSVNIELLEDMVSIQLYPKSDDVELSSFHIKIQNDLIDFRLRDIVTKETATIRELLIAKAFANFDEEQDPLTNVSDPVGFNPNLNG